MLMKPIGWRNNHAARGPIKSLNLAALRPHQGIALAGQGDDVRTGTMIMSLFVSPRGELGDMAAECVLLNLKPHLGAAGAPFFPLAQVQVSDIGNEVGLPHPVRIPGSFAVEIVVLRVVAIVK